MNWLPRANWYWATEADVKGKEFGHDEHYYAVRRVRLDPRGTLRIDPTSHWGFDVAVITASHQASDLKSGIVDRPVIVGPHTWVASNAVLYNCVIGEGAIVAAGTVVRSCEVRPWTMVAGNPPQVIARCPDQRPGGEWVYLADKWTVLG